MIVLDPMNPLHLIPVALAQSPDSVIVLPVFAPHAPDSTLVLRAQKRRMPIPPEFARQLAQSDTATQGNGTCAEVPTHIDVGRLLLTVPADVAENLRGPVAQRHPLYLISVHRELYDDAIRQATSGIVLPGAPMSGGGIIKP